MAVSPAEEFLLRHNLETYMEYAIRPHLIFGNLLPMNKNDTLEFNSVVKNDGVLDDIANKVLSMPHDVTESVDFSDVKVSKIEERKGSFIGFGFRYSWTDDYLLKSNSKINVQNDINKIVSALIIKANALVIGGLAGVETAIDLSDITGLSDWTTNQEIKSDFERIAHRYRQITGNKFGLGTQYVSDNIFFTISQYANSFTNDIGFKVEEDLITANGRQIHNGYNYFDPLVEDPDNLFGNTNFIGFGKGAQGEIITPAIIENGVQGKYNTLQLKRDENPNNSVELGGSVPQPVINFVETPNLPETWNGISMWMNLGVNIREPQAIIKGKLGVET